MKIAVYNSNSDIKIEEAPKPELQEGEILLKVKASGICGTDIMEWYRKTKGPHTPGHEVSGIVSESRNPNFQVGQRIVTTHHVSCDNCDYCQQGLHTACDSMHSGKFYPGGFSEYVRIPKINTEKGTFLLPENLSYEEGTMMEPLGCCLRAQRVLGIRPQHTVLILGSGIAGLLHLKLAKLKNSKVISTDINDFRLKKAREFGADQTFNASQDFNSRADRVIVCTGAMKAMQQAFANVAKAGKVMLFAVPQEPIPIPSTDFWRNEITAVSSYGAAPGDLKEALDLISSGKINVKPMITHKFPLENIQEAYNTVCGPDDSLKVIINPS